MDSPPRCRASGRREDAIFLLPPFLTSLSPPLRGRVLDESQSVHSSPLFLTLLFSFLSSTSSDHLRREDSAKAADFVRSLALKTSWLIDTSIQSLSTSLPLSHLASHWLSFFCLTSHHQNQKLTPHPAPPSCLIACHQPGPITSMSPSLSTPSKLSGSASA